MAINKGYLTAKTNKKSDEYYTPREAILPLLEFIKPFKGKTVWCPFDKANSNFVTILREAGLKVIYSHIDNGQNFFYYEPDEPYDVIISNPPFSIKDDVLQRLYELKKPYAILLPLPALQGQKRFPYLVGSQALIFDKRINFWQDEDNTIRATGAAFATIYVCKNFLSKDLIFKQL